MDSLPTAANAAWRSGPVLEESAIQGWIDEKRNNGDKKELDEAQESVAPFCDENARGKDRHRSLWI